MPKAVMSRRVAIIDDDVWVRNGRGQALAGVGGVEVVATLSHAEALRASELWSSIDVVLVDAWDPRGGFDRFPGVSVVEAIRSSRGPQVTIVVITGHVVNDMLRLRMAEAGADYFYGHDDVSDVAELVSVVTSPEDHCRPRLGPKQLARLGVRSGSQPNSVLTQVSRHHWQDAFSGESQKSLPVSRRGIMKIRRELGEVAKLVPSIGPSRQPRWPEWQQIVRFVNLARGADAGPRTGRARPEATSLPPDGLAGRSGVSTGRGEAPCFGDVGPLGAPADPDGLHRS